MELVAKILFGNEEYQEAFIKLQDCLAIRLKILNNPNHVDIIRTKKLLKILYQRLKEVLVDDETSSEIKEISSQIVNRMKRCSLYADITKANEKEK